MSIEKRTNDETVLAITLLDPKLHPPIRFTKVGEKWEIPALAAPPRYFTAPAFSRWLHKTALNAACLSKGHDFAMRTDCDTARKFGRAPKNANEFRAYGQYAGHERPAMWTFTPYENKNRPDIRWVLDMPLHGQAFAVCIDGDHEEALKVLTAHARTRADLQIFRSAKQAIAALPSRKPSCYLTTKPDDGNPDFLINIAMLRISVTFGKGEAGEHIEPASES